MQRTRKEKQGRNIHGTWSSLSKCTDPAQIKNKLRKRRSLRSTKILSKVRTKTLKINRFRIVGCRKFLIRTEKNQQRIWCPSLFWIHKNLRELDFLGFKNVRIIFYFQHYRVYTAFQPLSASVVLNKFPSIVMWSFERHFNFYFPYVSQSLCNLILFGCSTDQPFFENRGMCFDEFPMLEERERSLNFSSITVILQFCFRFCMRKVNWEDWTQVQCSNSYNIKRASNFLQSLTDEYGKDLLGGRTSNYKIKKMPKNKKSAVLEVSTS